MNTQRFNKMVEEVSTIKEQHYDLFHIALRADGVVRLQIKTNDNIEVATINAITAAIGKIGEGAKIVLLVIASEFALPSAEARAYMATMECDPFTLAEAFVVKTFSQKLVGNVYLSFNKPARPTRIFTAEEPAIAWLKTHL